MGDARNLLMALAGDACIVIGGRAGTKSEVHLAWLHRRPLLPLVGCGGWSDELPAKSTGRARELRDPAVELDRRAASESAQARTGPGRSLSNDAIASS